MTEQNENVQPNEALFDIVEKAVTTIKLPLIMHKSGQPVVIGEATVTKHDDHFELYGRVTEPVAQEFGALLTSGLVTGVTLGGVIDRKSSAGAALNKLN
ncbi:hypothetical protein SEA_LEWANDO_67 [Arthrobacter phage Lewando]|nr:hypothetical protein SEA_LEWANDO_67 [Arthrobacter phage Lewando]